MQYKFIRINQVICLMWFIHSAKTFCFTKILYLYNMQLYNINIYKTIEIVF